MKTRPRRDRVQLSQAGLPNAAQSYQERMMVIRGAANVWGIAEDLRCRRELSWVSEDDRWRLIRVGYIWDRPYRPWVIKHHQADIHDFSRLPLIHYPSKFHPTRDEAVEWALQQTTMADASQTEVA